jgi:hypothetical protein
MIKETPVTCPVCFQDFFEMAGHITIYDKYQLTPYCDLCEKPFCSEECIQLEAYEDTFDNCCPGVYWCIICRTTYFKEAKGHLFFMQNHSNSPDLLTYCNIKSTNGAFVDQCKKCGVWSYEFRSKTDAHSPYEGVPCGPKIREFDDD